MFQGAFTATVTPFRDGRLDEERLTQNVAFQIEQGIDGLVPAGTTGESPTLSHDEHRLVIEKTIEAAAGKVKVIAGTGSNSTQEALALTRHAKQAGADAALMVNPYYNKPSQEGLYRHFMTVADAVDLPIVLYNIPGRTAVQLSAETIARLSRHDNIVAVKEATGSMDMASDIATLCASDQMTILSGDDSLTLPLMSIGAKGVISVASNLIPAEVKALTAAALKGDFVEARRHHLKLFPLFRGMLSLDVNPVPLKTAMRLKGRDTGELRLPLCEMSEAAGAELERVLQAAGL